MKRWPIIRHICWFIADYRVWRWVRECERCGIGDGVEHPRDKAYLNAIWRGEA